MPDPEKVAIVVSEWVAKAENDLKNAAYTLGMGEDCPTDTVCFHAQQVVEKYIKALLTLWGIPFPKTHDIQKLAKELPDGVRLNLSQSEMDLLTDYAAGVRYPGYDEIPLLEAQEAVRIAQRVRGEIRNLLPDEALWRK